MFDSIESLANVIFLHITFIILSKNLVYNHFKIICGKFYQCEIFRKQMIKIMAHLFE